MDRTLRTAGLLALLSALTLAAPRAAQGGGIIFGPSPYPSPAVHALRGALPGLTSFEQEFVPGDHRIRRMAIFPKRDHWGNYLDPALVFEFRDQNFDDSYKGRVTWIDVRQHALRTVSGSCRGTCRLAIPAMPSGDAVGLAGFDLQFTGSGDQQISEVAVRPNPQLGYIDVTFTDDSGDRPFLATIYYVRLVALEIQSLQSRTSTTPATSSYSGTRMPGFVILRSFRLAFTNGQHHLKRWGVDLCPSSIEGEGCTNEFIVHWRDVNGDDPFNWSFSYAVLRPETIEEW